MNFFLVLRIISFVIYIFICMFYIYNFVNYKQTHTFCFAQDSKCNKKILCKKILYMYYVLLYAYTVYILYVSIRVLCVYIYIYISIVCYYIFIYYRMYTYTSDILVLPCIMMYIFLLCWSFCHYLTGFWQLFFCSIICTLL